MVWHALQPPVAVRLPDRDPPGPRSEILPEGVVAVSWEAAIVTYTLGLVPSEGEICIPPSGLL